MELANLVLLFAALWLIVQCWMSHLLNIPFTTRIPAVDQFLSQTTATINRAANFRTNLSTGAIALAYVLLLAINTIERGFDLRVLLLAIIDFIQYSLALLMGACVFRFLNNFGLLQKYSTLAHILSAPVARYFEQLNLQTRTVDFTPVVAFGATLLVVLALQIVKSWLFPLQVVFDTVPS